MATTRTTRSREKPEQIADELRALIVSGQLAEGDVARARARPRRALRRVAPVAAGGAAHPRGRGPHHRRPRRARWRDRPPAQRAHDRADRRAGPPVAQRDPRRRAPGPQRDRAGRGAHPRRRPPRAQDVDELTSLVEEQRAVLDDPEAFGTRQRPLPRAPRRPGREPDVEHRGRDAQRDRRPGRHRGEPGRTPRATPSPPAGAGSGRRSGSSSSSPSAPASTPRRTGAPTWKRSAR